jgi:hypothetical protein
MARRIEKLEGQLKRADVALGRKMATQESLLDNGRQIRALVVKLMEPFRHTGYMNLSTLHMLYVVLHEFEDSNVWAMIKQQKQKRFGGGE